MKSTQNQDRPSLILASQSPVRKALLSQAGLIFETVPAHVDEAALSSDFTAADKPLDALAGVLASAKAAKVGRDFPNATIVGADQILVQDGTLFHKPANREEARARLQALNGRSHSLVTAVCLHRDGQTLWTHTETAQLTMHPVPEAEIDALLDREGDKAFASVGAYRIEGPAIRLFAEIAGDHFAILGLPLLPLLGRLRSLAPHLFAGA